MISLFLYGIQLNTRVAKMDDTNARLQAHALNPSQMANDNGIPMFILIKTFHLFGRVNFPIFAIFYPN